MVIVRTESYFADMGGIISYPIKKARSIMDENVKKTQEFMLASQQQQVS